MSIFDIPSSDPRDRMANEHAGFDPQHIDAFNASPQEMRDQDDITRREMQQTYGRALEYEAFTVQLPASQTVPTQLFGYDLSRLRALVVADGAGVAIGKWENLASGAGYRLPANASSELQAVPIVYAINTSAAPVNVSVWLEKSAK